MHAVWALIVAVAVAGVAAIDDTTTTPFDILSSDRAYRLVARACNGARDKTMFVPVSASVSVVPQGQWLRYTGLDDKNDRFSVLCWQPQPVTQGTTKTMGCLARSFTGDLVTTSYRLDSKFLSADVFYHNEIVLSSGLNAITTAYALGVGGVSSACPVLSNATTVLAPALTVGLMSWNTNDLTDVAPFALVTSLDTSQTDGIMASGVNLLHP